MFGQLLIWNTYGYSTVLTLIKNTKKRKMYLTRSEFFYFIF